MRRVARAFRSCCTAIAALALIALAPSAARAQFSSIFFFGDSFTDTGNATGLAALNGLPNPTAGYPLAGRFSNGPVYAEVLAERLGLPNADGPAWLGLGTNFAVGGATTGALGLLNSPTGLLSQGAQFAATRPPGPISPTALFVIWGGGNDIINAVALPTPAERQLAVNLAVSNLNTLITNLVAGGARNFLIPLLPNVGVAPLFAGDPVSAGIATGLTNTFNALLGAGVQTLDANPFVNAYSLNLNNLLTNLLMDAAAGGVNYGITNATAPCLLAPNPAVACNPSIFVDQRHPTAVVHTLIANAAFNRVTLGVDVTVAPEPTTVVLLGAGLAMVGLLARRRRSA